MSDFVRHALRLFLALALAGGTIIGSAPTATRAGDVPIEQPVRSLQAAGETRTYIDQSGSEVWEVSDGWDLDLYLYRPSSPLDFAIDVDRDFGPVDAAGHPAPGNALFGRTGRITLRVFDVDDDAPVGPEVDHVYVNGHLLGTLSGANDQWSVNTFEFPLSHLRLPTAADPDGHNQFWVDIDTTNRTWAVMVDWAAVRLTEDFVPLAFVHGFPSNGATWGQFRDFVVDSGALDAEDMAAPSHSNTNLESGSAELAGPIDDLVTTSGAHHTNMIAHSYGGLVARLYAWDHPSRVDKLILIGVPNGGLELADAVCLAKNSNGPWAGILWAAELFDDQIGDCKGPQDALYQLQTDYVRNVFNVQVPDRHGTEYQTITGLLPDEGRMFDLYPGADDGMVTLDSSEYLWRGRADHPGKHLTLAQLPLEHGQLITDGSDAMPIAVCELYGASCPAGSSALLGAQALQPSDIVFGKVGGAQVPAGGSNSIALEFEGASEASVVLISDNLDTISPSLAGATFGPSTILGADVLAATITTPATGQLQITNTGTETASVIALVGLPGGRSLETQAGDSVVEHAAPVDLTVALTEAGAGDVVSLEIVAPSGTVIPVALTQTAPGAWTGTVTPTESGIHSVAAWVGGARQRFDSTLFTVSSGQAVLTGAFTERLDAAEHGLGDDLVISPELTIATAGRYRLSAELADSSGAILASGGIVADLPQGTSSLDVRFAGRAIFDGGADGPYQVVNVVLSRDGTGLVLEDRIDDLGPTLAYDHMSFDHFPIAFDLDGFSDEAVDVDSDGTDDELRVHGSVTVEVGGTYAVNARLLALDRTEIAEFQTTSSMTAGEHSFTLVFDGDAIAAAGKNGPYLVEDLSVYPISDADMLGYLSSAHRTAAYTAADFGADTTPPTSSAGPLNATYTSNTVSVPYTAADTGGSGVASVELWARYQKNEAQAWGPYAKGATGTSSPVAYTFAAGDGNYEFYTVAVDGAGNREAPPAVADTTTRRDAVNDPPDSSAWWNAVKNMSNGQVSLIGEGTAVDDRTPVTVSWQVFGVKSNGTRQRLFNFKPAMPDDGAFNSRIEGFSGQDVRNDGGWVYYDIDVKVTAGSVSTTKSTRITVFKCIGTSCTG